MVPLLGLTLPPITPTPILRLLRTPGLRATGIFSRTLVPTPLPISVDPPICYETPVGSWWCLGVVHNTLSTPIGRITIHIYLVRTDGTALLDQQVAVARKMLAPGETAPYGALFTQVPAEVAGPVAVVASTEQATNIKSASVEDIQSDIRDSQYHIAGTLVNKNEKPLDNLSVVATLYDSKGNVTGFRQVNLPANQKLAPGVSLPFSLDVIPQGTGTTRVEVSAEGRAQ